ncbi:hypothetical protein LF817_19880 [Halobacillus sp. A1]|uniref:hypothetical protein n=1 Tax=Halobacillus sp. A1 TaxID=2880262 RepID=UPI0020A6587E|nr:hypothetical protein [Halobacillus sp. A1]MCP3033584.1 hypothetical protein [Halobacillus sp. A1]
MYTKKKLLTDDTDIENLIRTIAITTWKQRINPKKSFNDLRSINETLTSLLNNHRTSNDFKKLINAFEGSNEFVIQAIVREHKKYLNRYFDIPKDLYQRYVLSMDNMFIDWNNAKYKGNIRDYLTTLEDYIEILKEMSIFLGYKGHPYEAFLSEFIPEITLDEMEKIMDELEFTALKQLNRNNNNNRCILYKKYSKEIQTKLMESVLQDLGFDFSKGLIVESSHAFMMKLNSNDVRLAISANEYNLADTLYSTLHEFGHAIYEQNISYKEGILSRGISHDFHEAQAKLFETFIGKKDGFINYFSLKAKGFFPELKDDEIDKMFNEILKVNKSLVRTNADEASFILHIIMRYRLEKGLIGGTLSVKDIDDYWQKMCYEYFGKLPSEFNESAYQDVHWGIGNFGHFPSYIIGLVYGAHIYKLLDNEIPLLENKICEGKFKDIHHWLTKNIYSHGSIFTSSELFEKLSNEKPNTGPLLSYLKELKN